VGRLLASLVLVAVYAAPDAALAKGGPLHLFTSQAPQAPSASQVPAINEILAGCGRGRYRDPISHRCRGPADLRN
jgi:hypothetical protein